jgi:hypothetical protein
MGTYECRFAGGRPVVALAAEIVPGVILPSATTVPDLAFHRESTAIAFGVEILVQIQARLGNHQGSPQCEELALFVLRRA